MIELLVNYCGWIGCILLAICGLPEAHKSIKTKYTGLTWGLLLMWVVGELLTMIYVLSLGNYPLLFNYATNLLILTPVLYYKIYPGGRKKSEPLEK